MNKTPSEVPLSEANDLATVLKQRIRPFKVYPLTMIWKDADKAEMFTIRPNTIHEQSMAIKRAEKHCKDNGIEDPQNMETIRVVFCLHGACQLAPRGKRSHAVQLFSAPEDILKLCTFDEIEVLNNCYKEILRIASPGHTKQLSKDDLEQIINAVYAGENLPMEENPMQAGVLETFARKYLVEIVIRLSLMIQELRKEVKLSKQNADSELQ